MKIILRQNKIEVRINEEELVALSNGEQVCNRLQSLPQGTISVTMLFQNDSTEKLQLSVEQSRISLMINQKAIEELNQQKFEASVQQCYGEEEQSTTLVLELDKPRCK